MNLVQADSTPTMSRVYGDQFVPQVTQTQPAGLVGVLDTTWGTAGSLVVTNALTNPEANTIQTLSDGSLLVGLSEGTSSIVAKYDAQGALVNAYDSDGLVTLGLTNVNASMVDTQGRLIVSGTKASGVPMQRVLADGSGVSTFVAGAETWTLIAGVAEQSSGAIIAVGYDGTNAQICRYLPGTAAAAGALDVTFNTGGATPGAIIFTGGTPTVTSTSGLYGVVVDASDNIYVTYLEGTAAKVAKFTIDGVLDVDFDGGAAGNGIIPITYLNSATAAQMRIAIDAADDIVIAGQVTADVKVTSIASADGTAGTVADFTTAVMDSLYSLAPVSDGKILISGSNDVSDDMIIMRLTSVGGLDTTFNNPTGYNLFNISDPNTTSVIKGVGLALSGQIYAAGYQDNGGTVIPYVSRLYNDFYVSQVAQSPLSSEEGNTDLAFGTTAVQTYAGVVTPFNGAYGSSLMQQATSIIEVTTTSGAGAGVPAVGDIVVGMNGFTDASASSSMMLSWLDSTGAIQTDINSGGTYPGYLTLNHDSAISTSAPNEYLTSVLQGQDGVLYTSGYASLTDGSQSLYATIRAYSTAGTTTWTVGAPSFDESQSGAGYKGIAVGTQAFGIPATSTVRVLLFVDEGSGTGHISRYTSSGTLDLSFGVGVTGGDGGIGGTGGSGTVATGSYGLAMGPCYGGVTLGVASSGENIIVAYKNSGSNTVDVASILADGSGLTPDFGTSGTVLDLFSAAFTPTTDNVRICFNDVHDIIVTAVSATTLYIACLDSTTGDLVDSFGTNGIYSVAITGATSLQVKQATGVDNGQTLVTMYDDATDDTLYTARITSGGALDTTFNSQGAQQGVLPVQVGNEVADYSARKITSTLVQSTAGDNQGNIVIAGYESVTANDSTPMVYRSFGAPGSIEIPYYSVTDNTPTGTVDEAYDLNTLHSLPGGGTAIFSYPAGNAHQGYMLVGTTNGTDSIVSRIDVSDHSLDTTFGSGTGKYTIASNFAGINSVTIDADNNILVTGTTATPVGWARRIADDGASEETLTMPTATTITGAHQILQQKSGRYIVAGKTAALGVVIGFRDELVEEETTLGVDPTFNPLSIGTYATAGTYTVGTTGVYSIAINTDDTILAVYEDTVIKIDKITADGSGLDLSFDTTGSKTTTITPASSSVCRIGIDSTGKVVVASSNVAATAVDLVRYTSAGATDTTWNGTGITANGPQTISNVGTAGVALASMMQTTTQQTVFLGYNTADGNGRLFAARLASDGALDATWNTDPAGTDTAGVLTYASGTTPEAATINAGAITINGTVASIGSSNGTAGDPIVTYVYGDSYVTEFPQESLEAAAGTLDSTIPGSTAGALPLATLPVAGAITGVAQRMYIYNNAGTQSGALGANGAMLLASVSTDTVYISQLNADLTLNSNFGGGDGVVSFTPVGSDNATITDMYVANGTNDTAQPIYVAGYTTNGTTTTMFAAQISANGVTVTEMASTANLTATSSVPATGVVRQSSNSRMLVTGFDDTNGVIVAYDSNMTAIDTSFGNGSGTGYYTSAGTNGIYAMATDNSDRTYIAYQLNGTTINVERILENGTALDTKFSGDGIATMTGTAFSATQIRMAIDLTNEQVVVAAVDTVATFTQIKVARYNFDGTTAATETVSVASKNLVLSDLFIDNDNATDFPSVVGAYPNVYVVGYNSTDSYAVTARINSTVTALTIDATYGASGIANLAIGAMTVVTAGALDPDRRVYMVGSNGSTTAYMGRFYGDYYWTEASPAILQGTPGTLDITLNPDGGANQGGINLETETTTAWDTALSAYTAYAIIENPTADGTSFIAFGNGTNVIVGKINADMSPVTAFDTDGLTTAVAMATVTSMTYDSLGNIIVSGTNAGAQKVLSFLPSGALNATFDAAGLASTVGTTVLQQKSGRYIVGGYDGSANGLLSAYQNDSAVDTAALPIDPTFGPAANSGYYPTGINAQVDAFVIDSNDYIYYVYRNSGVVNLAKLTPEGSLSTSANTPSAEVWSTNPVTATGITATSPSRIAINSAGNVVIAASTAAGVLFRLYTGADGTAIAAATTVAGTAASTDVLTGIVGSGTGFYGAIHTAASAFAFSVTSAGLVDANFGSGTVGAQSGAMTATATQGVTSVNGISVQADGKIVMVGGNVTPSPLLISVYAHPFIPQYAQAPNQADAGLLDTTLWPTTGALKLDVYTPISTTVTEAILSGSEVSRIYEYANGKALFVFSGTNAGADTVIVRVNKDLTLDTSFSGDGVITITGSTDANALFVNSDGDIFVGGGTAAQGWVYAYNSVGTQLWANTTTTPDLGIYQIIQQTPTRLIVSGKEVNGTLFAYDSSGALDITFGLNGVMTTGVAEPVTDISIDSSDRIICISSDGEGNTVLHRVPAAGIATGTFPSALTGGTAIDTATGNATVILDQNGEIVVASATVAGFTIARYNNDATGTNDGTQIDIVAGGTSTSVLGNMYATSDGKSVMVGYETTGDTVVVARLTSGFILDTTFDTNGVLATTIGAVEFLARDAIIAADDRVMLAGGSGAAADPYIARVFGDDYVTYVSQAEVQAVDGTLDPTWGVSGIYDYAGVGTIAAGSQGKAILALTNGGYYMALTDGTSSQVVRTLADGTLDTAFNSTGIADVLTGYYGVNSIMLDGSNRLVLTGTDAGTVGTPWIARYVTGDSGALDTSFSGDGIVTGTDATELTAIVEQTLARYVVAGKDATGAVLYAYTALNPNTPTVTGVADTTFNAGDSGTPGYVQIGSTNGIYNLIADSNDRLIFAVLNTAGTSVDLYRLTPTGELDTTFGLGLTGKVSVFSTTASTSGFDASSIRVALDSAGNIVVAAYVYTTGTSSGNINIAAYDNGTANIANTNGVVWTNTYAIENVAADPGNEDVSLTALVTTSDNNVLVLGNALGASSLLSPTWIARLANTADTGTYALDTVGFNPAALDGAGTAATTGIAGIFEYSNTTLGITTPFHVYSGMTVLPDGRVDLVGYENNGGTITPTVVRMYNTPYTTEESQSPNSQAIGTNDLTLGLNLETNGVTFFGVSSSLASYNQVARAIALQDDNNLVVAVDGASSTSGGNSEIFLDIFNNDGLLNLSFNTTGQQTVLSSYDQQFVQDMVTFTTVAGVHKAILAGYVTNTALTSTDSLLLQYDLTPNGALDTTFGGFNANPQGIAFGDGKQANVVGRQSNGRIIVGGQSQNDKALLLGYTADGKMDSSFGSDGYLVASATSNALYTHAIDTENRVVIAYRDTTAGNVFVARFYADGSGLDTSFSTDGLVDTGIVVAGNNDMRIAVDASNNVVVAMIASDGTTLTIRSYDAAAGGQTTTFDPALSLTAFTLSRLLIDLDGKAVIVGSDNVASDQVVIARTTTALTALDTTFNNGGTQGYLKYAIAGGATQQTTYAMIHPDGRILIVGSETLL